MEPIEYSKMDEFEENMWWYNATHKFYLQILRRYLPAEGGILLDGGCGTGGLLKKISKNFKYLELIGLENNQFAISVARSKTLLPIIAGSINRLPVKAESITAITSCDVLYHKQAEPLQATQESFDALKVGGIFVVQVPGHSWMMGNHDKQVHTAKRYTRKELSFLLENAGFQVKYCSHRNSLLFPLMIIRRLVLRSRNDESDVTEYPPIVNFLFNRIMDIETFMLRLGIKFPVGGSVVAVGIKPPNSWQYFEKKNWRYSNKNFYLKNEFLKFNLCLRPNLFGPMKLMSGYGFRRRS